MANPWLDAPIVEKELAACPRCNSTEYQPNKGWRNDDGSRVSRRVCKCCRELYIVRTKKPLTPKRGSDNSSKETNK